jgi:cytochrome b561
MTLGNTPRRWGAVSQALHWVIVALIITQFVLAGIADDLPLGMRKLAVLANHKSVGITVLALAIVRLAWKRLSPGPALPVQMKPWERRLAGSSHHLLYLLMFATPLAGWCMSSAKNYSVSWFNLLPLPNLVSPNETLYEFLHEAHEVLAWTLASVAVLHAVAALRHHFIGKDDVLRRMLPFSRLIFAGLATLGATTAMPAMAASWILDPSKSTLGFAFTQAGARNTGKFQSFGVSLVSPGDTVAGGKLAVTIDINSLDTGDKDRDDTLRGTDLFDIAHFPRATFVATRLDETSPGKVGAAATLTMRGVSKPANVPMTVRYATEGGQKVVYLAGMTTVRRLDFGIGQGDWQSTEWVANEVEVSWTVRLVPADPRPPASRAGATK